MRIAPLLLLLPVVACGQPEPPASAPETYQVRGLIRHLPTADHSHGEVLLHHEAIPDFKDDEGRVVGMDAMAMPFPVEDESIFEGLEVGDKVTFELEIAWHGTPSLRLTKIEKLPPETELDFGRRPSTDGS